MTRITAALIVSMVATGLSPIASPRAAAQAPIHIGATLAQTGGLAPLGQNQLRGYKLCVKHVNERGGMLGRRLELVVHDDGSDPATAARLYEKLISQDRVDLVLGPNGSATTDAVATVTERHGMAMVAPIAADASIYQGGRRFVFSMLPTSDLYLEGLIDMAARKRLKTIALINQDEPFSRATVQATAELAKRKGLQVVLVETSPLGITDFSAILTMVQAASPDVLAVSTRVPEEAAALTRQMKQRNVNPRMYGLAVDVPRFYELVGRDAEFVYGVTPWVPELVELRAGGLIPVARQYPGAREFVEAHRKEFRGADLSHHSAAGYGGCQVLVEAVRRTGSLDSEKLREAILRMDYHSVFGAFRVDQSGRQIAHKLLLFQWQDGKKVIVWPEELAPGQARFPTPPWSQRQ